MGKVATDARASDGGISVIIVSYNNLSVLTDCICSIERMNDIGDCLEVIVVEQSEDDSICSLIKDKYKWVHVIRRENGGFGAGNNSGAKIAKHNHLLFLNPDTILRQPVFGYAISCFKRDSKLGMFGVRLTDEKGTKNHSFNFRKRYGITRSLLWHVCDKNDLFLPSVMYTSGADIFIRKDVFNLAGQFDENIFMYNEETDLSDRVNRLGYKCGYFSSKEIVHLEGRASGNTNSFQRLLDSLIYLCEKNGESPRRVLKKMKRDRVIKALLGWSVSVQRTEIGVLEDRISRLTR